MNTTRNFRTSLFIGYLAIGISSPAFAAKDITAERKPPTTVQDPHAKPKATFTKPSSTIIKPPTNYIAKPKPVFKPGPVKTKLYRVPGSVAISAAKRHGYSFGIRAADIPNGCRFVGMHWQVPRNTKCSIYAFEYRNKKCYKLRKGWEVTQYKLHNFVNEVTSQRANSWIPPHAGSSPFFEIFPDNSDGKSKKDLVISIDYITLKGPEGKFNKFEEAFSHCDDPSYRP